MTVTLIQGTVTHLERDAASISFRIRKHVLRISFQPELFLLENGTFVQLLVDTERSFEQPDVLALKCEGYPPIYLGPRMGWSCALAAMAVATAALTSHHEWFLVLPALLALAQGYFLMRRARVFECFTSELAELTNLPS